LKESAGMQQESNGEPVEQGDERWLHKEENETPPLPLLRYLHNQYQLRIRKHFPSRDKLSRKLPVISINTVFAAGESCHPQRFRSQFRKLPGVYMDTLPQRRNSHCSPFPPWSKLHLHGAILKSEWLSTCL
jgi:hypothetical protein